MRYNQIPKNEKIEIFDLALRFCQIGLSEKTCSKILDIADKFHEMGDKLDIRAMSEIKARHHDIIPDRTVTEIKRHKSVIQVFRYKRISRL